MEWTTPLPADAAAGQDHYEAHNQLRDAIIELRQIIETLAPEDN